MDTGFQVWPMHYLSSFYKHLFHLILLSQHAFEVDLNIYTLWVRELKGSEKLSNLLLPRSLIPRHRGILRTWKVGWQEGQPHERWDGRYLLGGYCDNPGMRL